VLLTRWMNLDSQKRQQLGGLISHLLLRRIGHSHLMGLINIEGNLAPEDFFLPMTTPSQLRLG
jgi:hypothetical protein